MIRFMTPLLPLFLSALVFSGFIATAQTPNVALTPVITGLSSPIYVTHAGDDRLFVVQQNGIIRVKQPGSSTSNYTTFLDISSIVVDGGEKGLLGLAFHPDYKSNGYFFVNYTTSGGGASGKSVLARYSVDPLDSNLALASSEVILDTIYQPFSNHNGGCIQFGPDGYLYMAMGDGGSGGDPGNRAQNKTLKLGKMLRYDVNNPNPPYYLVPSTNPFIDSANVRPEIWAYGLRNPWRFSFDRITGDMWIGDVGQNTREEIDFQSAASNGGENYGWRCYEGFIQTPSVSQSGCPDTNSVVWPVFDYTHSGGECSVTGGYVYRGADIGALYGHYVFSDYCSGKMRMLSQNPDGTYSATQLLDAAGMLSFGEDRWGELYVCLSGTVSKLTTTDCIPTAAILADTTAFLCKPLTRFNALASDSLSYQWLLNGAPLSGATSSQFTPTETGVYNVVTTNISGCTAESEPVNLLASTPMNAVITSAPDVCLGSSGSQIMASPAGGMFIGNGVDPLTGSFNPDGIAAGTQTVVYAIADSNLCGADTVSFLLFDQTDVTIEVPGQIPSDVFCLPLSTGDTTNYILEASIPGGTFSSTMGIVNGNEISFVLTTPGEVIITYSLIDSNGCNVIVSDTMFADICEGIENVATEFFSIYPNPATTAVIIDFSYNHQGVDATVFSTSGNELKRFRIPVNQNTLSYSLDDLPDGIFILRLSGRDGVSHVRLVKQSAD